jgi:hypothetical protein
MQLSKKSRALEQERHEELLNLGIYIKNRKDLQVYSKSSQQQPQQPQQLHVTSLIKHLDESIELLKKKAKTTKSEVNETYARMTELRENEGVSLYVDEKNTQKEKKATRQPKEKKKETDKEKKATRQPKEKETDKKKKKKKENGQNEQSKEKRKRVATEENSEGSQDKRKIMRKKNKSVRGF